MISFIFGTYNVSLTGKFLTCIGTFGQGPGEYLSVMDIAINEANKYSMNSQRNAFAGGYYLSPQNCYGARLMFKVVDKKKYSVDMNVGAERSYNPLSKKWEMNYSLGPDIRLK